MTPTPFAILAARVAAIERQLGDQPGIDNLQPNVLVQNADGTIGADLSGGLQLPAPTLDGQSPPNNAVVRWVRSADGSMAARISAFDGTLTVNGQPVVAIEAKQKSNPTNAGVIAAIHYAADGSVLSDATILDTLGRSSFAQLHTTAGGHGFTWGDWTVNTPAMNNGTWGSVVINHGWGATPYIVWPIIIPGGGLLTSIGIGASYNYSNTQFTVDLYNASGINLSASTIHIGAMALI